MLWLFGAVAAAMVGGWTHALTERTTVNNTKTLEKLSPKDIDIGVFLESDEEEDSNSESKSDSTEAADKEYMLVVKVTEEGLTRYRYVRESIFAVTHDRLEFNTITKTKPFTVMPLGIKLSHNKSQDEIMATVKQEIMTILQDANLKPHEVLPDAVWEAMVLRMPEFRDSLNVRLTKSKNNQWDIVASECDNQGF